MKRIFLLLLVLIISISAVSAAENITGIQDSQNDLMQEVPVSGELQDENDGDLDDGENTNEQQNVTIQAEDLAAPYGSAPVYSFKVLDNNSQPLMVNGINCTINGATYTLKTDANGEARLKVNLRPGNYHILLQYNNFSIEKNIKIFILLKGNDLVRCFGTNPVYTYKITDENGNPIQTDEVKVTVKGKTYKTSTDKNGIGKFNINLKVGKYKITVKYRNVSIQNNINIFASRITTKNLASTYGSSVYYTFKLVDNNGKPQSGAIITFTTGLKKFTKVTDKNGCIKFRLNYPSGKYTITHKLGGLFGRNTYTVKNKISMQIFKWGNTGDVSRNPLVKNNMPNNEWVKKAVEATKTGNPLLIFEGGSGNAVFMTAGIHGNEMPPQVAAMKMIKYLSENPIKGTVYFMPFVNLKAISNKVRLTNYDFNRVANRRGTISNNIVNLIVKYKCVSYGDFHSTVSPGIPGKNIILGYRSPATKCVDLTNYLAKNCKVDKRLYRYAGEVYRWALADQVNYRGIPAVICEVVSPVNRITSYNVALSYKMMDSFLKYNSII